MGQTARCDICGCIGHSRMRQVAPDGWLFAEANETDEDGAIIDPEKTIMLFACSEACSRAFWRKGPGFISHRTNELLPAMVPPPKEAP